VLINQRYQSITHLRAQTEKEETMKNRD